MGRGGMDFRQVRALQKRLEKQAEKSRQFYEDAAKELAARLLAKVIQKTPVGKYKGDEYQTKNGQKRYRKYKTVSFTTDKGKAVKFRADTSGLKGGTLRRGWTSKTEEEAAAGSGKPDGAAYAQSLLVKYKCGNYEIEITNPVSYASYVEYGHRKRGGKGWTPGHFMLTISEKELRTIEPAVLERKLQEFLKGE